MLCMLLYIYGEWKLTGFFSIVVTANFQVHQMLKKKYIFLFLFRDDCINIIHF
ncbi:hypothetical protein T02_8372 [Trichinella nativa]|uniref:Uncharacterized protein n=1 Tax=Trichinella nativa TaxID=6335 RepID=A0A0V1L4M3_9BILA|nr:hypothetical protein T02_8372 [Trichinella nativa]